MGLCLSAANRLTRSAGAIPGRRSEVDDATVAPISPNVPHGEMLAGAGEATVINGGEFSLMRMVQRVISAAKGR